jgi:O-antigen ligase
MLLILFIVSSLLTPLFDSNLFFLVSRRLIQFFIEVIFVGGETVVEKPSVLQSHYESLSLDTRLSRAINGLRLWMAKPIIGLGLNGLLRFDSGPDRVHNSFLQVLIEQGLIGFFAYLFIWIEQLINLRKVVNFAKDPKTQQIYRSLFFMLVVTMSLLFIGKTWIELIGWFNISLATLFVYNKTKFI